VRGNYFRLAYNEPARENKGWVAPIPLSRKDELRIPWTPEEYTQSGDPVRVQEYAFWLEDNFGRNKEKLSQARTLYEQLEQGWNVKRIDRLFEE
jgi:hypothetical protein